MYTIEVNAKCVYSSILENDRMFRPSRTSISRPLSSNSATPSTIQFSNHERHEKTRNEEAHAGRPDVRAGGVFAGPLTSELADGP